MPRFSRLVRRHTRSVRPALRALLPGGVPAIRFLARPAPPGGLGGRGGSSCLLPELPLICCCMAPCGYRSGQSGVTGPSGPHAIAAARARARGAWRGRPGSRRPEGSGTGPRPWAVRRAGSASCLSLGVSICLCLLAFTTSPCCPRPLLVRCASLLASMTVWTVNPVCSACIHSASPVRHSRNVKDHRWAPHGKLGQ